MSKTAVKLTDLTKQQVVDLMKGVGSTTMNAETIARHIELGAPQNEDGTINLINYTAWLVRENLK